MAQKGEQDPGGREVGPETSSPAAENKGRKFRVDKDVIPSINDPDAPPASGLSKLTATEKPIPSVTDETVDGVPKGTPPPAGTLRPGEPVIVVNAGSGSADGEIGQSAGDNSAGVAAESAAEQHELTPGEPAQLADAASGDDAGGGGLFTENGEAGNGENAIGTFVASISRLRERNERDYRDVATNQDKMITHTGDVPYDDELRMTDEVFEMTEGETLASFGLSLTVRSRMTMETTDDQEQQVSATFVKYGPSLTDADKFIGLLQTATAEAMQQDVIAADSFLWVINDLTEQAELDIYKKNWNQQDSAVPQIVTVADSVTHELESLGFSSDSYDSLANLSKWAKKGLVKEWINIKYTGILDPVESSTFVELYQDNELTPPENVEEVRSYKMAFANARWSDVLEIYQGFLSNPAAEELAALMKDNINRIVDVLGDTSAGRSDVGKAKLEEIAHVLRGDGVPAVPIEEVRLEEASATDHSARQDHELQEEGSFLLPELGNDFFGEILPVSSVEAKRQLDEILTNLNERGMDIQLIVPEYFEDEGISDEEGELVPPSDGLRYRVFLSETDPQNRSELSAIYLPEVGERAENGEMVTTEAQKMILTNELLADLSAKGIEVVYQLPVEVLQDPDGFEDTESAKYNLSFTRDLLILRKRNQPADAMGNGLTSDSEGQKRPENGDNREQSATIAEVAGSPGDPPYDGAPGGNTHEVLGNPEERYNPQNLLRMATNPDYFREQMPLIFTDIAQGRGMAEGLSLPPRLQNRIQTFLEEGSIRLYDLIYREYAKEQGWVEERELPGSTTRIMMPVPMTSLDGDQLDMWDQYLAGGISRKHARLALDIVLLHRIRELPAIEDPSIGEVDAMLRRAQFDIAYHILPDLTDEEARLLFPNRNAADVQNLAHAPLSTFLEDEQTVLRTLSELRSLSFKERMKDNPVETFDQIMDAYGITSIEDIRNATPNALYKLIHPATLFESHIMQGDIHREQASSRLANMILERATHLRMQQDLEGIDDSLVAAIRQHDLYKVSGIPNEQAFWEKLLEPTEYPLTRDEVGRLYGRWREVFIQERKNARAARILEEAGVSPEDPLPDEIAGVEVTAENGNVLYKNVGDLIKDMQDYFLPKTELFEQGITASGAEPTVDTETRTDLVSFLNRYKAMDKEDMDRIIAEIIAWDTKGARGPYQDNMARERPYWYRFRGSRFAGHTVNIYKDRQGYHLLLHDYENEEANNIDNFAAFVDKDVEYTGGATVRLIAAPLDDPQLGMGGENVTAITNFSVKTLAEYFAAVANLGEEEVQQMISAAIGPQASRVIGKRPFPRLRELVITVPRQGDFTQGEFTVTAGEVTLSSNMHDSLVSDDVQVPLPGLVIRVQGRDQERINWMAGFLHAVRQRAQINLENQNDITRAEDGSWSYTIRQEE